MDTRNYLLLNYLFIREYYSGIQLLQKQKMFAQITVLQRTGRQNTTQQLAKCYQ